ncbi:6202_t:CDS:1, partial [Racocetra persica]
TTWDTLLPATLFAYRTLKNYTAKYDLFHLMYRYQATVPLDLQLQEKKKTPDITLD